MPTEKNEARAGSRWWWIAALIVAAAGWGAVKVWRDLRPRVPTRADVAAVFARVPSPTTPDEKKIYELLKELQDSKTTRPRFFEAAEEALALEEKAHGHRGESMDLGLHKMLAHAYADDRQYRKAVPHLEALLVAGPAPDERFLLEWMLSNCWQSLEDWPKARPHAEAVLSIARAAKISAENITELARELDKVKAMEKKQAKVN